MANLQCLVQNTDIIREIQEAMSIMAGIAIENDFPFSMGTAYNELRRAGIEIDLESVGALYERTFDLSDGNFSSEAEVNAMVGASFRNTVDSIVNMLPKYYHEEMKTLSPGKQAAANIAGMFRNANVTDETTSTLMKQFEHAVMKAAKRLLNKKALPEKATDDRSIVEILGDAFELEKHGFRRLDGALNGVKDVYEEMRGELSDMREAMENEGADEATLAQFDAYTGKLVNTMFDLAINTSEAKTVLTDALILAGYGREATRDGKKTMVLDWKKLTGGAGIVSVMKENVEGVLKNMGLSPWQIDRVQRALEDEYLKLKENIIVRTEKELTKGNQPSTSSNQKIAARKLAELHTYGLFEGLPGDHDRLLNKVFGLSEFDQATFNKLSEFARALQELFTAKMDDRPIGESNLKYAINTINERIAAVLREHATDRSMLLRVARTIRTYMEASQRMILNSLKNAYLQNPLSGLQANITSNFAVGSRLSIEAKRHNREVAKAVFKDMVLNGGTHYGDVSTVFVNRGKLDDMVNSLSDSKLYHGIASVAIGRAGLDAMDSVWKSQITEKYLAHNLIRILTDESNPKRMTEQEAMEYIAENLYGRKFEEAKDYAKNLIEKVNAQSTGKPFINESKQAVTRLANDIVKAQVVNAGAITEQQLESAMDAAYKAAGRDLGHVANNYISTGVQMLTNHIETGINKQLKRKNYAAAAGLTLSSIFFRNVMNPFVGGATNWIVLKAEKAGYGVIAGSITHAVHGKQMDIASEEGMKEAEEVMYRELVAKAQKGRGIVGGMASLLLFGVVRAAMSVAGGGDDDDEKTGMQRYMKWRKENRWASKYLDEMSPEVLLAEMSVRDKRMGDYMKNFANQNEQFSIANKLFGGLGKASSGETGEGAGLIGEGVGMRFNVPLPWRLVRDGVVMIQGATGQKVFQNDYTKSKGFWDGVTKGGFLEFVGARQKGDYTLDALPGVGTLTMERLRTAGIKDIKDLKGRNLKTIRVRNDRGKRIRVWDNSEVKQIETILKEQKIKSSR